jgi:hypothetical protein
VSYLDAGNCRPVTFRPHEVEELHWLLGQLEDWLLHASDDAITELDEFVNHPHHRDKARQVIDTLGRYTVELRRRGEGRGDEDTAASCRAEIASTGPAPAHEKQDLRGTEDGGRGPSSGSMSITR